MIGTKVKALVVTFALLFGADARAADQAEMCRAFADVVYAIAQRRDQGETIYDVRNLVIRSFDESIRDASLLLVDHVFKRPWMPASREADNFLRQCLAEISGSPAVYSY